MEIILWIGFYFLTFYAFLPALVSRIFGFRVFTKGRSDSGIALTFDDGPDPEYTPKMLDLLKRHGAKATFFVVGENAEKYPEIVARIHEEGHILGIHNYVHHMNWFMRPSTVKRQIDQTSDLIKRITGTRPLYYRPPWGILNVFDYANLGYLQIVLWTSLFGDWRKKIGPDKLYRRMKQKLKPGQVFLLHDCGSTFGADRDAPANTLSALTKILDDGKEKGYRFIGIDEMIAVTEQAKKKNKSRQAAKGSEARGQEERVAERKSSIGPIKKIVVSLWMLWEKLFHVLFKLRPVGDAHFFNYRVRRYSGPPLDLRNDRTLRSGDHIMEIHFENQMLFEMGMKSKTSLQLAIRIIREIEKTLPDLARELAVVPKGDQVKALYGVSMIHRGSEGLGFETFELPKGLFARLTNVYLRFLIRVIHPTGNQRVREHSDTLNPRMLIMERNTLLEWADESRPNRRPNRERPVESSL
ncbi:polysaccharide deacetylase family protein [Cohnella terricola]|uniref:Polysaccharide deacetylase family protein n=1 Tax=Cohnella terricola TaxID=1289167 RepID=A0A559JKS3_9BACL|nr:polysaccharide deacetylase family protein [Cohnella terricola]TVY00469.1 polysaccharide deacetylase family protein [Cohnella terricola]